MKWLFYLFMLLVSRPAFSQTKKATDSTSAVNISGSLFIANVGFAPLPAFSFNSPLGIGSLSIKKKRFSYEPDIALGFNGKPWLADNWFRYTFIQGKKGTLSAGVDPFFFFFEQTVLSKKTICAQRNVTVELAGDITLGGDWGLKFAYRYNRCFEAGALSGHFVELDGAVPRLDISKTVSVNIKPQLFYFDFTGSFDGLFTSTGINIGHKKIPVAFCLQGALPIWVDFEGNRFKWNGGFMYTF